MSFSINYNPSGSNLARVSVGNYRSLFSVMEKLASGSRINKASDGPASLVISEQLRTQIASLNSELDNTSLAISKYQTASSNLMEMRSNLTEMRALAISAANEGVNSESAQAAYDSSAQSLVATYNDNIEDAEFNGHALFDGSEGSVAELTNLEGVDLSTAEAAEASIAVIDEAISEVDTAMVEVGSTQKNELEASRRTMEMTRQNLMAAESQIRDADMALEISNFISGNIKLQMTIALMAHSNIQANGIVLLLGNH